MGRENIRPGFKGGEMLGRKNLALVFAGIALLFLAQAGCRGESSGSENPTDQLQKVLDEFNAYAIQGMTDWEIPGMTVAVVRGDEVIFQRAYGVKQKGGNDSVNANTLFQIGSASKAFTTALMAMDVTQLKYKWDDKVSPILPDFIMSDPWVTQEFMISDLSAQHSGLPANSLDGAIVFGFDRAHVRRSLHYVRPVTSFRSAYAYQNVMFLVDGQLVEYYSGKPWEYNVVNRIFRNLGMNASSVDKASYQSSTNVATLHHRIGNSIIPLPMDWKYLDWSYNYGPAGGVNSNIIDMTKWLRLHMGAGTFEGQPLIKEKDAEFLYSPQTVLPAVEGSPRQYYAQGWVHREFSPSPIVWHNGETSGCKSMVAFIPEYRVGVVVLSNLDDSMLPESLAWKFFDLYFDNPSRDWSAEELERVRQARAQAEANKPVRPIEPEPPLPLNRYAGDYFNFVYETVNVSVAGGNLRLLIGPNQTEIMARPWDGNTFMGSWDVYIQTEDIGFVNFGLDNAGNPNTLTIDYIDSDGCGEFWR
jgi:CubicO group peptidase (beta-lactamase class C family)